MTGPIDHMREQWELGLDIDRHEIDPVDGFHVTPDDDDELMWSDAAESVAEAGRRADVEMDREHVARSPSEV